MKLSFGYKMKDIFNWIPRTEAIAKKVVNEYNEEIQLQYFHAATKEALATEKERLEKGYSSWATGFITWDIIEKSTGNHIGHCGYHNWYLRHDRAEIGYWLLSGSVKRKGYMSEAVSRVIRYGFEDMKLFRIEAFVHPTNKPSIKIIEKNDFSYEGHKKQDYLVDGVYEDSLVYGLLKKDYFIFIP
jgi:ribosomal-protein-alanine N-acetyltransferase